MILHSLKLEHWRSLIAPVEIGPFHDRLNIIHAPNGIGKSSLFEAMRRTLFDAHNVAGKEIEAVRPWGRTLSPKVHVEFSQRGIRYRIEKSFLEGASARLLRFAGGKATPIAESKSADAQLRELLSVIDAPGRGLSKQEHWGLAQALWATQGAAYPEALNSSVTENIRAVLGMQLAGDASNELEQLLEERYLAFFTKGGKARSGKFGAPLVALKAELEALQHKRTEWAEKNQRFSESVRQVEDARQKRDQARHQADALRAALKEIRVSADRFSKLTAEFHKRRQIEVSAQERHEAIVRTLDLIRKERRELETLAAQISSSNNLTKELEPELSAANDAVISARRNRDGVRARRTELENQSAQLEDARSYLKDCAELKACSARVKKLIAVSKTRDELKERRTATVAPDDKTLRAIRKTLGERDTAQAALNASLIHLSVIPEKDAAVRGVHPECSQKIRGGKPAVFSGSPEVEIEVKGFGTIKASGPEGDADKHRANLETSKRKLEKFTQPFGTGDIEQLEKVHAVAAELDRKLEQADDQLAEILSADAPEELKSQEAELRAKIREWLARHADWEKSPPDIRTLKQSLDDATTATRDSIRETEDVCETALSKAQGIEKRLNDEMASNRNHRRNQEAAERRLTDLTKDGASDCERERSRQALVLEWDAAKLAAQSAKEELDNFPDDPSKAVAKLERQLRSLEDVETQSRDAETAAQTRVELLAAEGAYSKLAEIDEKHAELEARQKREHLRMSAIQLLYDTVTACKSAAVAAVAAPVEVAATRMFARVAGTKLGAIRLNDSFVPVAVNPEFATEPVEISNLSAGEQEQLFLIIRLALGQVLAKSERQLVVLDDVLNATDIGRLARVADVLQESADSLQIVILTCHPENYRVLEGAIFHDLSRVANN